MKWKISTETYVLTNKSDDALQSTKEVHKND